MLSSRKEPVLIKRIDSVASVGRMWHEIACSPLTYRAYNILLAGSLSKSRILGNANAQRGRRRTISCRVPPKPLSVDADYGVGVGEFEATVKSEEGQMVGSLKLFVHLGFSQPSIFSLSPFLHTYTLPCSTPAFHLLTCQNGTFDFLCRCHF